MARGFCTVRVGLSRMSLVYALTPSLAAFVNKPPVARVAQSSFALLDTSHTVALLSLSSSHSVVAMSSPTSVVKVSQDQQIRARLLNKLGIYDGSAPVDLKTKSQPLTAAQLRRDRIMRGMGVGYTLAPMLPDGSAVRSPLQGCKTVKEPLKVDGITQRKTRIAFQEDVEVMPIPTRYEYSDRIKSRIWSNRHELQENAERNALEFASEGWNWRNVTEDDGMYICSQSGELVHPIHLKHLVDEEEEEEIPQHQPMDGAPIVDEKGGSLERGTPVHYG